MLLAAAVMCLPACSIYKYKPAAKTDSVRVEYRERVVHDTVAFTLPVEVEKIITADTCSVLSNSVATSRASVTNGLLSHSLQTTGKVIRVPYEVQVRDTLIIQKQAETIVQEVPAPLSWWQRIFMGLGKLAAVLIIMAAAYFALKLAAKISI